MFTVLGAGDYSQHGKIKNLDCLLRLLEISFPPGLLGVGQEEWGQCVERGAPVCQLA